MTFFLKTILNFVRTVECFQKNGSNAVIFLEIEIVKDCVDLGHCKQQIPYFVSVAKLGNILFSKKIIWKIKDRIQESKH